MELSAHRPALLRHCYRMLGSFAEAEDITQDTLLRAWRARDAFRGQSSLERWLLSIATNACLNALSQRRRRELPQLERAAADGLEGLGETEAERWLSPAPDAQLFPDASAAHEDLESVSLAFVALLQRVPPRQRAALLLKDVLGWSAEEISEALELTVPSVNSALQRAREVVARAPVRGDLPSPETLARFVRAWAERDLEGLVRLLKHDVTLAMPPHQIWFRGVDALVRFVTSPRFSSFWQAVHAVVPTRANGQPALAFFRRAEGGIVRHSIMVARFEGDAVAEMTVFIGAENFRGFEESAEGTAQFQRPPLS
ncbi:MAG: RNA polymerase subunit sigma-70 [Myxococcota bacterium]